MEKERRTKVLVLSTLVVVVATLSIAFAAMSRTLNINGIGKMDTASWSVYFDNLSEANIVRGAEEVGKPSISDDKGTVQDINVKLSNPRDEISYTVDIVNDGTIDAEITMIKDIELTDAQKKVFEFKVTYTDTGEILQNGDILPKDTIKNITINIKFKDDITEFDLPTESQTINLSYQITYTQYDGSEIVIEPDGGDITTGKAVLAKSISIDELFGVDDPTLLPFLNGTLGRGSVESISFVDNTNVPDNAQSTVWDASENKDNSIIGWYQDTDSNSLYEVYIGSNSNIYAPSDSSALFAAFVSLSEINFNNFNTSEVTNMMAMFLLCPTLNYLDVSSFNTNNVTNMSGMFRDCASLITLDLSNFDTSNVTDMSYMFVGEVCDMVLTNINFSGWDTSKLTNMSGMFSFCIEIENLDLSSFDTSKVTDMSDMFYSCSKLTNLNINLFNTENVINMSNIFHSCSSLKNLDLSSFNTSKVTDMSGMFGGCSSLENLNLKSFDTTNVTTMEGMFEACNFTSLDLSSFETINIINTTNMFYECIFLESVDLSNFKVSQQTNVTSMFRRCDNLMEIKLNSFSFYMGNNYNTLFNNVPNNFTIYVKDETSKNFILELRSDANVIIEPLTQ